MRTLSWTHTLALTVSLGGSQYAGKWAQARLGKVFWTWMALGLQELWDLHERVGEKEEAALLWQQSLPLVPSTPHVP